MLYDVFSRLFNITETQIRYFVILECICTLKFKTLADFKCKNMLSSKLLILIGH